MKHLVPQDITIVDRRFVGQTNQGLHKSVVVVVILLVGGHVLAFMVSVVRMMVVVVAVDGTAGGELL